MTKKELINVVSAELGTTKKATGEYVDAIFGTIADVMVSGDEAKIPGFGSFTVSNRSERTCRNPQTGEQMVVPACKAPKFKAASRLKTAVNV